MVKLNYLEIHKEEFSFSAGHFTIFSATERERLHGHNYSVSVKFKVIITENGLAFDYRHYKTKLLDVCHKLDRRLLLPGLSPFLRLEQDECYCIAHFNQQKLPFLHDDVIILPLVNITIEELSHWFLQQLLENKNEMIQHGICAATIKVYNGPGQSAAAIWEKT